MRGDGAPDSCAECGEPFDDHSHDVAPGDQGFCPGSALPWAPFYIGCDVIDENLEIERIDDRPEPRLADDTDALSSALRALADLVDSDRVQMSSEQHRGCLLWDVSNAVARLFEHHPTALKEAERDWFQKGTWRKGRRQP